MLRRLTNLLTALMLSGAVLAPVASASIMGMGSHACCVRHHAASKSHCPGMQEKATAEIGSAGMMECPYCAPGLVAPASAQAKPAPTVISPAPASHPFLDEFYPAESSDQGFSPESQRAPPVVSSR